MAVGKAADEAEAPKGNNALAQALAVTAPQQSCSFSTERKLQFPVRKLQPQSQPRRNQGIWGRRRCEWIPVILRSRRLAAAPHGQL